MVYKPFKCKVEDVEDAVFESGAVKHAVQFMNMLKEVANHVQKKYSSDVVKMMKVVEHL